MSLPDRDLTLLEALRYYKSGELTATFSAIDSHSWSRLMRWTRAKYAGKTGLSMKTAVDVLDLLFVD